LISGNTITVNLPAGLVSAVTGGAVTGIAANAALSGSNIVLTASGAVTAAAQTVTICGVTLGSFPTNNVKGVSVMTTMDYTTTCSATGTVGAMGQVTAVSMSMPFANRVAGNTAQSVTFAFTTATALPVSSANCNNVNSVTITFPTNFFASNAAGSCGVAATMLTATGLTGYTLSGTGSGPSSTTTFVFTGTAALPAGPYTVVIGALTLRGTATVGDDAGIKVSTSMDSQSVGAPSGPISGYQVTSVTMPSCQVSSTCQNLVIAFSSTAGTIAPGGTLAIGFTTAPVAGTPDAFMSGTALITGALAGNTITLTVNANGGAWAIGSTATITLTGMTVASTGLQTTPQYVSVGGSTNAYSMMYMPTGTGKTTTTSLTVARPFPGTTNTMITVAFSTTNGIADGDVVRVFYPAGFFIGAPQFATCAGGDQYSYGATGLGSCNTLSITALGSLTSTMNYFDVTYSGIGQAAGAQTMVVSGITLSTTAVAASTTFSVVTTQNSCSAGMISTGAISNSNPGGSNAPAASTGASFFLSAAAAFACALLLLL